MTFELKEKMILQHRELGRLMSSGKATEDTTFRMQVRANLLSHLITYAGADSLCKMAKGGLVNSSTFPEKI